MGSGDLITINVTEILKFFDEKPNESKGHATSIVSIAGEDLGVGLFKHYLEHNMRAKVKVIPGAVTTGHKKGPRLDRWVDVSWPDRPGTLFQTEIKNFSAHAIGGRPLKIDASPDEINKYSNHYWKWLWDGELKEPKEWLKKVLKPMDRNRLQEVDPSHELEPLLIYWIFCHPKEKNDIYFYLELYGKEFRKLWFFSMSSYLRSLYKNQQTKIDIEMPVLSKRLSWLQKFFKKASDTNIKHH